MSSSWSTRKPSPGYGVSTKTSPTWTTKRWAEHWGMYRIDSAIRLFLLLSGQTITSDFFPPFVPSQILLSARYFGQSWRAATRLPVCWRPQRHRRDRLYGRLKITTLYSNNNPFFCSSSSLKKKFETDAVRTRSLRRKRQQQTTLKRKHLFPPLFSAIPLPSLPSAFWSVYLSRIFDSVYIYSKNRP